MPISTRWIGLAFVLVWCTGYIAGKLAVEQVGPMSTLVLRFGLAGAVFTVLAALARVLPGEPAAMRHSAVVGVLVLAMQFGGMYLGMRLGASAGVAALVTGLMPLAVAALVVMAGDERLGPTQWTGMALGVTGVALVVADRFDTAMPAAAWAASNAVCSSNPSSKMSIPTPAT